MTNGKDAWLKACLILLLIFLLVGWFAGCYAWVRLISPIQIQVPRD